MTTEKLPDKKIYKPHNLSPFRLRIVESPHCNATEQYVNISVRRSGPPCRRARTRIPLACYHLRRARARKIYYLRRSRRQRQEHSSREVSAFPARPRPLRRHHPRTGGNLHTRKDSRRAAALRHLGPFSVH